MRGLVNLGAGLALVAALGAAAAFGPAEAEAAPPAPRRAPAKSKPGAAPPGSAPAPASTSSASRPPASKPPAATSPGKPAAAKPPAAKPAARPSKPAPPRRARPAKRAGAPSKPRVVFDQGWAQTPAARYAALDRDACLAELGARAIAFTPVAEARGVVAPVRLPKDVGGIVWRTELPAADRARAPWDVVDCRVVLSMFDWASRLRARGVVEVLLFSAWRPPPKTWPAGKPATRHPGALAIDVKRLVREKDPTTGAPRPPLDVEKDWAPDLGAPVCGHDAPPARPDTPEGRELRAIACDLDDARLFTVMLTPHYDRAHHNHLHLELTPNVTWRLTR